MDPRALDEAVARSWPARETLALGSWLARLDDGVTRRANSILPYGPVDVALERRLEDAAARYLGRGLVPWLQVTRACDPALEPRLRELGWETGIDRTLLLAGPLPEGTLSLPVRLAAAPDSDWIDCWWTVDSRGDEQALASCRAIIGRIAAPAAYASVRRTGETVAEVDPDVVEV